MCAARSTAILEYVASFFFRPTSCILPLSVRLDESFLSGQVIWRSDQHNPEWDGGSPPGRFPLEGPFLARQDQRPSTPGCF